MPNSDFLNRTVGELVVEQPCRSRVFEQFKIDYCCGGNRLLADACAAVGVTGESVVNALNKVNCARSSDQINWSKASMTDLIDNILTAHHAFLRQELPRLSDLAAKVARAHGHRFPWILECERIIGEMQVELESHMMKEEEVLFPMIRQFESATTAPDFHCGSIGNPIAVMEHEHDETGQALLKLRELTNGFIPPDGVCNTFRAMLDGMSELESDLHEHIHKENNILFPRARNRELSLGKRIC